MPKTKKLNKIFFIIVLPLFLCLSAKADVFNHKTDLKTIEKQLPHLGDITCKFAQEKQIQGSKVIIKSGGDFKFEKNKGVTFYTTYPIKSTTSYTQKEYKQINSIIKAVSNKQYGKLEKEFDFYFEKKSQVWILGLKPKSGAPAANYLDSIEIDGKIDISKIEIITKDKTKTSIRFFK